MKYLLIDGNNLACRCVFANEALTNSDGIPTGAHYGFFQSLISTKVKFSDYQMLVVWDGKSKRRMEESAIGVQDGIIPELYKANRKKDAMPKPLVDFYEQAPFLQKGIGQTGIPQIRLKDYEADDVIASYCNILKSDNEIVCLTSDGDYYQLLDKNVALYDGMKQKKTTKESFEAEFGIGVNQFIDVGAFMGDTGDNIFGVDGWGIKTAIKEVKKYGSYAKVIEAYEKEYGDLRKKHIDLHERLLTDVAKEQFKKLAEQKSNPEKENSRLKYPGIYWGIPYSGVALAFEEGDIKMPKSTLMALMFKDRVKLAYSLKKMDIVSELPEIIQGEFNRKNLMEYFEYYDIETLKDGIDVLEGIITNSMLNAAEDIETDMSSLAEELND